MERTTKPRLLIIIATILLLIPVLTFCSWATRPDSTRFSRLRSRIHHQIDDLPVNSTSEELDKRLWPFESSTYTLYRCKGARLYSLLQTRENIPATAFTQVSDLAAWGWVNSLDNTADRIQSLLGSIQEPLGSLGLGTGGDVNVDVHSDHSAQGPDQTYQPTKAKYYEVYNPSQGAIIAYRNYGPASYTSSNPDWGDKPLPKLKQFSDVVFLTWLSLTSPSQRQNLRYVIRVNVMNDDTRDVVEAALKKDGVPSGVSPIWPGHTFTPEGNLGAFQALLGTPNVSGVAWLLLQHEEELGQRTIKSITVWDKSGMANQDAGTLPSIVIEIGPQ